VGTIEIQNQILVLQAQRTRLQEQVRDMQDTMRKIRERHIDINDGVYCQLGGTYIKKHPKEVYPALEREVGRLMGLKNEIDVLLKA
jgi:chaperonin cofactor prefoldin